MILYQYYDGENSDYETIEQPKQTSLLSFEYSACAQCIILGFLVDSTCQFILVTYLITKGASSPKDIVYLSFFICHLLFLFIYQIILLQNHRDIRTQLLKDLVQNRPSRLDREKNPLKGKYWDITHQMLLFMESISFVIGQVVCEESDSDIPYYIFLIQHGGTFLLFGSIFIVLIMFAIKTFGCCSSKEPLIEDNQDLERNYDVFTPIKHCKITAAQVYPDNSCAICLQQYIENQEIVELDCDMDKPHLFHNDCFSHWASQHNTCPLCRKIFT